MFKVLIVDDEKIVRIALKSLIDWNEIGLTVVGGASNGLEALNMVEKLKPDIIISDLKMPKMDGISLLKQLNEQQFPGKVLILSNYGEYALVREALKLGAEDYILKVTLDADQFAKMLVKMTEQLKVEYESKEKQMLEQAEISEIRKKIRNDFYKNLFYENGYSYSEIEHEAARAGINSTPEKMIMLDLVIDDSDHALADSKVQDRRILIASIENIVSEILSKFGNHEVIKLGFKGIVVLLPLDRGEISSSDLAETLEEVSNSIQMYLNIRCSIVVSDAFEGFYSMKKAFQACEKAAELTFYGESSAVILAKDANR